MAEIDVRPGDWATVVHILSRLVPERDVAAFGSRARWEAKEHSDLDLAVLGTEPLKLGKLASLKAEFTESNLPFSVDVIDWAATKESFRRAVENDLVLIHAAEANTNRWPETRLGEIVELFDGPHATPTKQDFGPVFLGISNLAHGRLDLTEVEHLSEADFQKWTRRIEPRAGDVVFSYETRLGEAALIPPGLRCCLGRRMGLLRPNRNKVDPRFLLYAYLGPDFQETLRSRTIHGSTVDRLPLLEMPDFPLRLPKSLAEQRAIARILSALDDKIELNRRMSATLEEMARALFRSWFVDFDPVRAKAEGRDPGLPADIAALFPDRFEESELGEIPAGWEVKGLDEVAEFLNGLAMQRFPPTGEEFLPVVKIAQLRAGNTVGADRASPDIPEAYRVADGDVLFSWSGSLECSVWTGGPGALNQHLFKVTAGGYPGWLAYLGIHLHLEEFRRVAASKATTMGHIQRHHLSLAKLTVPPAVTLDALSPGLEALFEATWRRRLESRTLAALRDSLLPKLISGELRVPEELLELASEAPAG